jgi:hypothetical protein
VGRELSIGRRFTVSGTVNGDGVATYIQLLSTATTRDVRLRRLTINCTVSDPTVETLMRLTIERGSGGAAAGGAKSVIPLNSTDATAVFTVTGPISASNAFGAGTSLVEDAVNSRIPYDLNLAPDEAPSVKNSTNRFLMRLFPSPSGVTVSYTVFFESLE